MTSALLAIVVPALAVSACGSSSSTSGAENAAATGGKPTQGGTIYYAHEQETPCLTGGWEQEGYVERQFLDNLVAEGENGKILPWLATSWSESSDHLTYTFHLKPGVKFTDGTPVNAQAIVDNIDFQANPKTGNGVVADYIDPEFKDAKAINELTVEIDLKEPYAPFLGALAEPYAGIVSPKTLAKGATALCDEPVGSGPFIVKKWNHGQNIEFVRNPNYNSWPGNAKHHGPAYVDKLVWSYVVNPTTRYGALTSGQANVIYDVPGPYWKQAQSQYNVEQKILGGRPNSIDLNTQMAPFNDVRVRQAFAYGANRKQAVESAFDGKFPYNGDGYLGYDSPGYDAALTGSYAYNPQKAEQLLDEAGWTQKNAQGYRTNSKGEVLKVGVVYVPDSLIPDEGVTMLQDLQQQWQKVGFDVKLEPKTLAQAWGGELSKPTSFNAFASSEWCSYTPALLNIIWRFWNGKEPNGSNNSFYNNAAILKHIQTADADFEPESAKAEYTKAQEMLNEQALELGAYPQATSLAWEKKLHDIWIAPAQQEPIFADAYFSE